MTARDLQVALLKNIRQEYEHNLAQQIYVSDKLWQIISQAKSGTINLISAAYGALPTDASAQDLLREITKKMQEINLNPATTATSAIRSEASQLFNL